MSIAIPDAITTLAEAERQFKLLRTEDEAFFLEWQTQLPELSEAERSALDELRRRYLYQRAEGAHSSRRKLAERLRIGGGLIRCMRLEGQRVELYCLRETEVAGNRRIFG